MILELRFTPRVFVRPIEDDQWQAVCLDFHSVTMERATMIEAVDRCFADLLWRAVTKDLKWVSEDFVHWFPNWASGTPVPYKNSFDVTVGDRRWQIVGLDVRQQAPKYTEMP